MNPLAVLGRAASLFAGMVAAEWQAAAAQFPWADGEQPVVEEPQFFPGYDVYATVPQSSAATEAAAVEVPTPESALPQPSVGHPNCDDELEDLVYADLGDYPPMPRNYETCPKCNDVLELRHYCTPRQSSEHPVIDPVELRDAALALHAYKHLGYVPWLSGPDVLALSQRLSEYADALKAFDSSQQ